jgi:diaminopropionate ammonia-lyase
MGFFMGLWWRRGAIITIRWHHHSEHALIARSCPEEVRCVLADSIREMAREAIAGWSGYRPTDLRVLESLADELGLAALHYKDESDRFGLASFKALGGAYAVQSVLRETIESKLGMDVTLEDVGRVRHPEEASSVTVVTATDGNHGRSVAWGARRFGCACEIFMHEQVSPGRQEAVEAFGARVRRIKGNYDDSVHAAAEEARANGWQVVSDTSWDGYVDIPRDVMAGYTVMSSEAMDQWPMPDPPTHVFIQGGCGGLAAAVCVDLWCRYGDRMPRLVIVEPVSAACLHESARLGMQSKVDITTETVMAGLSCGEVSSIAWPIIAAGASDFLAITDDPIGPLMRRLAHEESIVAGESAVAGLAGLTAARKDDLLWNRLGLSRESRVLLFGTEGATDPDIYRAMVGGGAS